MPKIMCYCKQIISLSEIPNPNEWLIISDKKYDDYQGNIDSEDLYSEMNTMLKCPNCHRLWIYWEGMDKSPDVYELCVRRDK